jgi:hypothetical protein
MKAAKGRNQVPLLRRRWMRAERLSPSESGTQRGARVGVKSGGMTPELHLWAAETADRTVSPVPPATLDGQEPCRTALRIAGPVLPRRQPDFGRLCGSLPGLRRLVLGRPQPPLPHHILPKFGRLEAGTDRSVPSHPANDFPGRSDANPLAVCLFVLSRHVS